MVAKPGSLRCNLYLENNGRSHFLCVLGVMYLFVRRNGSESKVIGSSPPSHLGSGMASVQGSPLNQFPLCFASLAEGGMDEE